MQEDTQLIQAWLNVSKDSVIGVDQKADSFWLRIKEGYNEYCGNFEKREEAQLKSRWHKLNSAVQKFVGCYKQAIQRKKNGSSEKDIMAAAHAIFSQDEGETFKFEHAWRLLKDEPKRTAESMESSSKRTKISASGTYSSSSNLETPTNCDYDPASPMVRPKGQKAAKRKNKAKAAKTSSKIVDLSGMEEAVKEKNSIMAKIAEEKQTDNASGFGGAYLETFRT